MLDAKIMTTYYLISYFVAWLLIRSCRAQIAVSFAGPGGAVASAGGVTAVAPLPGFGGFNNGYNQNFNNYNNYYPQQQGGDGFGFNAGWGGGYGGRPRPMGPNRRGMGRPPMVPPPPFNNGMFPSNFNHGMRPPPHHGMRPPPPHHGMRPPPPHHGMQPGFYPPYMPFQPQQQFGPPNGQPPENWYPDEGYEGPYIPNEYNENGAVTTPATPVAPNALPTAPPTIPPTRPVNTPPSKTPTHDSLIMGTMRPPLFPQPQNPQQLVSRPQTTPASARKPPAASHSVDLSKLRDIIFPSNALYVHLPTEEPNTAAAQIDPRRRR